jgi:SAM-dependent methyltransferase
MGTGSVRLAPPGLLPSIRALDSAEPANVSGIGWALRQRLKWVRDALPGEGFATVLEVGYGNGIFMHELSKHATRLFGCDVHTHAADVRRQLRRDGVMPYLVRNTSDALPFRDGAFDAVVIVSVQELLARPATTLHEASRVVRPGGAVVCIAPRALRWATRLRWLLGEAWNDGDIQEALLRIETALADRTLRAERSLRPRLAPRVLAPYEIVVLRRLPEHVVTMSEPTINEHAVA